MSGAPPPQAPRALLALGQELERVAELALAQERRRRGGAGVRAGRLGAGRLGAIALCIGLLLAAAAAAAVLLIQQGSPLPSPHAADLRSGGIPLPGSERLAGLDAPDPDGSQPPWDLRLSRTADGETCTAVGQVLHGRFGLVGLDRVFRALPLGGVDACGIDARNGPVLAGARDFLGASPAGERTVVSGVAGAGTRSVTAYGPDGTRRLRLGPDGSFITVYAGEAEAVRPSVVVVARDGKRHAIAFERSPAFDTADPAGGPSWSISASADLQQGAAADESCVQAMREPSQRDVSPGMQPLAPEVCGRLAAQPLVVSLRRFVPGSGAGTEFPWGNAPSRTLVYGIATPRVATLSLSGGGVSRREVAIDRHGGAFLAVLDGIVDPRALTLTAGLRGGGMLVLRRSTGLLDYVTNRPLGEPPVPAYRASVATAAGSGAAPGSEAAPGSGAAPGPGPGPGESFPPFELPVAATVREALRATDPTGGPTWVVRSWQGRANPAVRGAGTEPYVCEELGIALRSGAGARLLEPTAVPSALTRPLSDEREAGRCDTAGELERLHYTLSLESFLEDPYAYAPKPARTLISGLLPPGASDAVLVGAGTPRPLPTDANGAFLIVLAGRFWTAEPHIAYRLHGREFGNPRRVGGRAPARGALGAWALAPQSRAPDPDGSAPWGFSATARCSTATGRAVDDMLAGIDLQNGVLQRGAIETSSGSSCLSHPQPYDPRPLASEQVEFNVEPTENTYGRVAGRGAPAAPSLPEVESRTLPGRTLITGVARADVVSVTLQTPSDVRTLRPAGPQHTILAVYAGFFVRGTITATIRLRDGRLVTQRLVSAPDMPPTRLSPAGLLASTERQISRIRAHRVPGSGAPARARGAQMIALLEGSLASIRRRVAFEREHPGLLPSE